MKYLTKEDLIALHTSVVAKSGGGDGVRDDHALLSLEKSPAQHAFGQELYPTPFLKAAVYAREIMMQHPFFDGNKRSGIAAALVFLELNGYSLILKKKDILDFAIQIVTEKLGLEEIANWLKKHSKKRK
ncbi:MAG: type II toxin-antitoxin system death-on-curing family toxin [Candidatus Vogelbacteria bacterium CG10_big_fil_rev_8_21_14_0_10_45_14]|uniref:Type II toxin-antitoxin system death-on-curing family toxin n=1 Tax=Candidatus Vogelbacteria bacterium CG10_big_fil_rev_8_21_14_0_10_45_14 TaxID=1975042 RepID=A0A2H0RKH6_9BACT|nr:MAG: type II toxin-antitoxin system death-on-curing family toxin [Candidatus Vogelbacteria bacterium CG10_big_fil_rev_8_21_14_0_10_45_14]